MTIRVLSMMFRIGVRKVGGKRGKWGMNRFDELRLVGWMRRRINVLLWGVVFLDRYRTKRNVVFDSSYVDACIVRCVKTLGEMSCWDRAGCRVIDSRIMY